jgi:MoxR-like ATPase
MQSEPDSTIVPEEASGLLDSLRASLEERVLGQSDLVEGVIAVLVAGGHVLVEGPPGLGKTRLIRSLADLLGLDFGRVQCTPDLMPGDVTGGEVLSNREEGRPFQFVPGPVFCQVLLADEINRATPRTQSAFLEAMEEGQVTCGGETHPLPRPFFLAATQNPIELEGTYPLPEAQLDRFLFRLDVPSPPAKTLEKIFTLEATPSPPQPLLSAAQVLSLQGLASKVVVSDDLISSLAAIIRSTHPDASNASEEIRSQVAWGASPRAGQAALAGARAFALMRERVHVSPDDLKDALAPALRHRVLLRYEARAEGATVDSLLTGLLERNPLA